MEVLALTIPDQTHWCTGIPISDDEILIYGGKTWGKKNRMNSYILDRKTKDISQWGEVPGSGGLVICNTIQNGYLYSLWESGEITVLHINSGKAWKINVEE